MITGEHGLDMLQEYQSFADSVQAKLHAATHWERIYAGYAAALLANRERIRRARGTFRVPKPLHRYLAIGEVKKTGKTVEFDLRYLGQSVGQVQVVDGQSPKLTVSKTTATNSKRFGYGLDETSKLGEISQDDWKTGKKAAQFRAFYQGLLERTDTRPRQPEHMVESALFSELEKPTGDTKQLELIQPIFYENVRLHMKTALAASEACRGICEVADPGFGGDIDVFCRRKGGYRSRLTVIEVKDENKSGETFHLAIRQAIAYAVFIQELARSESGRDWMELWGLGKQPWEKGFTINAVAAMPKGNTEQFPFAGMKLKLGGGKPENPTDWIELHYMAFLGEDQPRDGQDVRFETSL